MNIVKLCFCWWFFVVVVFVPSDGQSNRMIAVVKSRLLQRSKRSVEDTEKKYIYFADRGLKTRAEAQTFCQQVDDASAELAIITGKLIYNRLRLGDDPLTGIYWINGLIINTDPSIQYSINTKCARHQPGKINGWNLDGITPNGTAVVGSCLALVKGVAANYTYLEYRPCTDQLRVLCSIASDGDCN